MTFVPSDTAVFVTLAGSHAHGTSRADSDVDLRGVCVAPPRVRLSYRQRFEQSDAALAGRTGDAVTAALAARGLEATPKVESVLFDVTKFVRLCADANPNALEILFADQRDWLFSTRQWTLLHARRQGFLSAKVGETYLRYGLAQLKRIKSHRSWLLSPPEREPARGDFGLPNEPTLSAEDRREAEAVMATVELPKAVTRTLSAERRYRAARRQWDAYQRWKRERNPARAALETRFGYDTKHAAHLVRLMRTGAELLSTGQLHVRRTDADELVAIRDGAWTFDELAEQAGQLESTMAQLTESTSLPVDVDHDALDELLFEVITAVDSGEA